VVDRIEDEAIWLFCPGAADVFIERAAVQDFETASEVVGGDEVRQVGSKLFVAIVVISIDGRFLDGSVSSAFWQVSKLDTVIDQHRIQSVWYGPDQRFSGDGGSRQIRPTRSRIASVRPVRGQQQPARSEG
jgi:hypothetical protein